MAAWLKSRVQTDVSATVDVVVESRMTAIYDDDGGVDNGDP